MKEREPDFENEKIRAWLIRPCLEGPAEKEHDLEGLEKDPTVITIDEESEEIFEGRAYHFRPGPETFSFSPWLPGQDDGGGYCSDPSR